ncbi:sulfite exporter TauE/SafE family protein [Motilimonas pumila]|nr:sulfite exporter TauE/SafE family protein [Motilimonas pumila]
MDSAILIAMLVIIIGAYLQSAIGFGLAIATAPVLYFLSPDYVPAPITMVAVGLSLTNAWHYRQDLSLKGLSHAILGRIPGTLAGGALLWYINAQQLSLLIGLTVLAAVAVSLLPVRIEPTPKRLAWAGFFSGLFGTSSGIGGPPMALLLQHQAANVIRANLAAFFLVSSLMSLAVQGASGYLTWHHVQLTWPLIPASFVGYWLAKRTNHLIAKHQLRMMSLVLCCVSGGAAVVGYVLMATS